MKLTVFSPARVEVQEEIRQVSAESEHGHFTLEPRHVDYLADLVAGIVTYQTQQGQEQFLAVDGGLLVKAGQEVRISSPRVTQGALGQLRRKVEESFEQLSQRESQARSALEKMQSDFVRRFMELQHSE
jgi:F-type H+-transporting ATPase subunit epsilon